MCFILNLRKKNRAEWNLLKEEIIDKQNLIIASIGIIQVGISFGVVK